MTYLIHLNNIFLNNNYIAQTSKYIHCPLELNWVQLHQHLSHQIPQVHNFSCVKLSLCMYPLEFLHTKTRISNYKIELNLNLLSKHNNSILNWTIWD